MATSGSIAQTRFEVVDFIDRATLRCGVQPQTLTAEQLNTCRQSLQLLLLTLWNKSVNLWCVDRLNLALRPNKREYDLQPGTMKLSQALYHNPQRLSATWTSSDAASTTPITDGDETTSLIQGAALGNLQAAFTEATAVKQLGLLPAASGVVVLVCEVSDGVGWTTVSTIEQTLIDGQWVWVDIDPSIAALYFRVRATTGTIAFREVYISNSYTEIVMSQLSGDDYAALPNKDVSGQPLQYYFDKARITQRVFLWPVPATSFAYVVYWAYRLPQDITSLSQEVDVPLQWVEAIIAMLAAKLIYELPQADLTRAEKIEQKATTEYTLAMTDETDHSPLRLTPSVRRYTR